MMENVAIAAGHLLDTDTETNCPTTEIAQQIANHGAR